MHSKTENLCWNFWLVRNMDAQCFGVSLCWEAVQWPLALGGAETCVLSSVHGKISTLLDRIAHVCITTAHARRSGRSAKLEINKPSTSKLVRSLDEKFTGGLSPILHSALIFAHAQFYLRGCLFGENASMHWIEVLWCPVHSQSEIKFSYIMATIEKL